MGTIRALLLLLSLFCLPGSVSAVSGWSAPVNLSDSGKHYSVGAAIAKDADGKLHAAYVDFLDADSRLYYTTNRTGSWVRERIPLAIPVKNLNDPAINIIWRTNLISVVVHSDDSLYEITKPLSGSTWSTPLKLAGGTTNAWHATTLKDTSGGLLAVYLKIWFGSGDAGALYARYKPAGGEWGAEQAIMAGQNGRFPANPWAVTANGAFWVTADIDGQAWVSYRAPGANSAWSARSPIHKWVEYAGGGGGRVAISPNGETAVAYFQNIGGERWYEPFVAFSPDSSLSWSRPKNIAEQDALDRSIQMLYDSAGTLHVVWESFKSTTSSAREVYYRSRANGVWGPSEKIADGGVDPKAGLFLFGNELYLVSGCDRTDRGLLDVCLRTKNVGGNLAAKPPLPPSHDPFGWIRELKNNRVKGWAYDPDAQGKPIPVEIRVDGKAFKTVTADAAAGSQLVSTLGLPHASFGFDVELTGLTPGKHKVEALARNVGAGADAMLFGSGNQIDYEERKPVDPIGAFQDLSDALYGWTYDANAGTDPIKVRVFIDGKQVIEAKANVDKYDLKGDSRVPHIKFGFKIPLSDLGNVAPGDHQVEVYAVDYPTNKLVKLAGGPRTLKAGAGLQPLGARLTSLTVPTDMRPGQTYEVTVVYRNTGTRLWKKADKYRLGFQNPTDNGRWGLTRADFSAETVAPGEDATFKFSVKAPGSTGTVVFQTQMLHEGESWFGDVSSALSVYVSAAAQAPTLSIQRLPSPMLAGQAQTVTWSSTNATTVTWRCTASGSGFTGSGSVASTSGTASGTASSAWVGYPSTCTWTATGPGGSKSVIETLNTVASSGSGGAAAALAATLTGIDVPATMRAGQSYGVTVTYRNSGTSTWSKSAKFRLGFQSPEDTMRWGIGRVELGSGDSIKPGQTMTFKFSVKAPGTPGIHVFQVRMLQEGVAWFGETTAPLAIQVQ